MIAIPLSGRPCVRLYEACEHLDAELHGRSQRGRTSDPQSGTAQRHGWWDGQTAWLAWLARMAAWLGWWLAEAGILVMITIPLSGRPCVRLYEACEHLDAELHGRSQRGRTSDPQSGRAQWHGWWDGLAAWLAWLARMAAWLGRWLAEAGTLLVMIAIPLSGRPCVRLYEACEHLDAELHGRSQRGRTSDPVLPWR
jgi:hypothetical protein